MKILQVISHFSSKKGGAFTVCHNLSQSLSNKGHDVTILTSNWEYDKSELNLSDNVTLVPLDIAFSFVGMDYLPGLRKWVITHIRDYDIIHIHGYRSYDSTIVIHYARKWAIPYIIQPHGSYPRIIEKHVLKVIYDSLIVYSQINSSKKVIAVSNTEGKSFIDSGIDSSKIKTIYNGVDVELYYSNSGTIVRNSLNNDVLYVGRLHPIKGIDILIKSMQIVIQYNPSVSLSICGTGDEKYIQYLYGIIDELGIQNHVNFLGHVSNLKSVYSNSALLVYPSIYEIFGLVPFEALVCGTPVIVTDDCGCGEIIGDVGCGYLVKYGDVEGLANQIQYALSHDDENQLRVQKGQEYILRNLSWDMIANDFLDVYTCVLLNEAS